VTAALSTEPRTVVFAMLQESGHLNPTFPLARWLEGRGFRVRYLAIPDLTATIEAQGFATVPMFSELFPRGSHNARPQGLLAQRREISRRYRRMLTELARDGEGVRELSRALPDVMLVDVTQSHFAFWARRAGIPVVYVNTSLPQTEDPGLPPIRSEAMYAADLVGRLKVGLAWRRFVVKRRASAALAAPAGMRPPYDLARKAAAKFGIARRELDCATAYMPQLRDCPELVLCPESFDFPRPPRPGRRYVGVVDLDRQEPAFGWEKLPNDKPLVYCALGGQLYRASDTPGFFKRVVQVFREHPEWQLLLATGQHMRVEALGECPPNVVAVERAPQLSALKRARVMITHGGLNSVKECIANGVPMLVFPLDVDQPGNAARVEYHGIGLRGDVASTPQAELETMLQRTIDDPAFARRCRDMGSRWQADRQAAEAAALETVEQALR